MSSEYMYYNNGNHRYLPSFPTRRSSDLGTDGMPAFLEADWEDPEQAPVVQPSAAVFRAAQCGRAGLGIRAEARDRKSTRLNSSHLGISYAVFCLKKKKAFCLTSFHRLRS